MTSQQTAFFTQNGYIELEGLSFKPEEIFSAARTAAAETPFGRDLWRKTEILHRLLTRKLAPAIFSIATRPVRLACDQWITQGFCSKPTPIKDLVCIQGLTLCALFSSMEIPTPTRRLSALGIPPFPSHPSNVLLVKPNIVLDWPLLAKAPGEFYLAVYALPNQAVYVHNPQDPATYSLKDLGYEFGDVLKDPSHPIIINHG